MTDTEWHYTAGGASVGPRSFSQMKELIGQGEVTAGTLVWSAGMAEWTPAAASELRGFFAALPPMPPTTRRSAWPTVAPPVPPAASPAGGPAPWMGFAEAARYCLTNYVKFSGRGSRSQYWFFVLFICLILLALLVASVVAGGVNKEMLRTGEITPLAGLFLGVTTLFNFAVLLPILAVTSRRMHDAGWSFWWFLVNFVPYLGGLFVLALMLIRDRGPNRFDAP